MKLQEQIKESKIRKLRICVYGVPMAKQSARFMKRGDNIVSFQPKEQIKKTESFQAQIIQQLPMYFQPFSDWVQINNLTFVFPFKKSENKKTLEHIKECERLQVYSPLSAKTTRPDLDNLEKMVWDAMNGVVFLDDGIITRKLFISKIYGSVPRIEIELIGE